MEKYDYVIVGGGLSGTFLGYLLKQAKKSVIIIEKEDLKLKEKVCSGVITSKTYDLLNKYFNQKEIDKCIINTFSKVSIMSKYKIDLDVDLKILSRKKIDNYILNEYKKIGGLILDKCIINEYNKDYLIVNNEKIKFKYLIGADGAFSNVRKKYLNKYPRVNYATQIYYKGIKQSSFNISFVDSFKGYIWDIKTSSDSFLGTIDLNSDISFIKAFEEYKNNVNGVKYVKMGVLPFGSKIILNKNNIYFVGDAAGFVDPIRSSGIYYALKSGESLFNSLTNNKKYKKAMFKDIINIKHAKINKKIIYNYKIRNKLFFIVSNNKFGSKVIKRYIYSCLFK